MTVSSPSGESSPITAGTGLYHYRIYHRRVIIFLLKAFRNILGSSTLESSVRLQAVFITYISHRPEVKGLVSLPLIRGGHLNLHALRLLAIESCRSES